MTNSQIKCLKSFLITFLNCQQLKGRIASYFSCSRAALTVTVYFSPKVICGLSSKTQRICFSGVTFVATAYLPPEPFCGFFCCTSPLLFCLSIISVCSKTSGLTPLAESEKPAPPTCLQEPQIWMLRGVWGNDVCDLSRDKLGMCCASSNTYRTVSLQEILGVSHFWKFDSVSRSCEDEITVEAACPSTTRMFLAQLLMCLKRSGPSKIPPYHLDTTTMTLRTSRIWGDKSRTTVNPVWAGEYHGSQQVHQGCLYASSSLAGFWSQKQSRRMSRIRAFYVFIEEKALCCISWTLGMEGSISFKVVVNQCVPVTSQCQCQTQAPQSGVDIHLLMEGERCLSAAANKKKRPQSVLWLDRSHPHATFIQALLNSVVSSRGLKSEWWIEKAEESQQDEKGEKIRSRGRIRLLKTVGPFVTSYVFFFTLVSD